MMLIESIGVVAEPKLDADMLGKLLEGACAFLRAHGTVTLTEWNTLTSDEKAALAQAGKALDVERAVWTGLAAQGPQDAAKVFGLIDGGDASAQMLTDIAASALKGALAGVEVPER